MAQLGDHPIDIVKRDSYIQWFLKYVILLFFRTRSTNIDRTIDTMQCLLAGMFDKESFKGYKDTYDLL